MDAPDTNEVPREPPQDDEVGFCDQCGEEKPVEGGKSHVVDVTYVDHMVVSTESDWFCKDCDDELTLALEQAEVDRHERMQDDYYHLK